MNARLYTEERYALLHIATLLGMPEDIEPKKVAEEVARRLTRLTKLEKENQQQTAFFDAVHIPKWMIETN